MPCGGRPESVNISNVGNLWDAEGKPNFKYIVEGGAYSVSYRCATLICAVFCATANLFITQQARLALEKKGVILFKDASANKGGVTSSSLEVLSGLSLTDPEFLDLMTTQNPEEGVSDFYANYVQEIQRIISMNAASEFNCIWKESLASKKPRAVLTDEVGQTLINLQDQLEASDLWSNVAARRAVLSLAIPKTLLNQIGLDGQCTGAFVYDPLIPEVYSTVLLKRLPETYAKSLFASYIASRT